MGPNLKILVTSRAALHVYGEHEFPVPPLGAAGFAVDFSVEILLQCPAVALFVQRAVAAKPDFELNRENASAVTEICARLDGLPLAIELAAARVKVLSPSSMLTRLASRLQLLTGGARDLPERQQTLRAAMDWSFDLLGPAEQRLFRRLSVFVGGCTLERRKQCATPKATWIWICSTVWHRWWTKVCCSRLSKRTVNRGSRCWKRFANTLVEKLEASGEKAQTKRAHAAYCLVLAEEDATEQGGVKGAERLESFALEHDNIRAASSG